MRLTPLGLLLPLVLTGCSLTPTAKVAPVKGSAIQGKAFGGQQPIHGAHIYAYAASTGVSNAYFPVTFIPGGLNLPTAVTADSSNNIYVAEAASGVVFLQSASSSFSQSTVASGLADPTGIAVDGSGDVFIADDGPTPQLFLETPNGSGGYIQSSLGGTSCGTTGVAVDSSGNAFTVGNGNSCTEQVTEYVSLGGGSYSTNAILISSACVPTGIAVDGSSNLYIACSSTGQVLLETNTGPGSYTESTLVTGLSTNIGGISADSQGDVFIADTGNDRVLKETNNSGTYTQSILLTGSNLTDVAVNNNLSFVYISDAGTNSILGEIPDPTASVSLLTAQANTSVDSNGNYFVTTDANGNFNISGDYTCNPGDQVYLYATGGDSGGGPNPAIGLLAVLGNCPAAGTFAGSGAGSIPFVFMDEISTVAAAYVMAPFATDATHVATSGSSLAQTGIANAFANAAGLAGLGTGQSFATNTAGATVPQATIDTIANILGACVNSPSLSSSGCSTLVNNLPGSITDTASAALALAQNPYPGATQIASLCVNQVPAPLFTPDLPCNNTTPNAYPNDFTLSLTFTGNGINQPNDVAIDATGNAWIASSSSVYTGLTELSPAGAVLYDHDTITTPATVPAGMTAAYKIGIDGPGNIWITNNDSSAGIVELSSAGTPAVGSPFQAGNIGLVNNIAIDPSNNIWLSAYSQVDELDQTGTPVVGTLSSPYTDSSITGAYGIALDAQANVWLTNIDTTKLVELNSPSFGTVGAPASGSPYTDSSLVFADSLAFDLSGTLWIANGGNGSGNGSISAFGGGGFPFSGLTTGSSFSPNDIAVDFNPNTGINIWVTSSSGLVEFNSGGTLVSPSVGYLSPAMGLAEPTSLAIDGSGNVWVTLSGGANSAVSEFIGLAKPVVTPLAANLQSPYSSPGSAP